MSDKWYIRVRGETSGPWDRSHLESLIRQHRLGRLDEVSFDNITWRLAAAYPDLFPQPISKRSRRSTDAESHVTPSSSTTPAARTTPLYTGDEPACSPSPTPVRTPVEARLEPIILRRFPLQPDSNSRLVWIGGGVGGFVLIVCLIAMMLPGRQSAKPQLVAGGQQSELPNVETGGQKPNGRRKKLKSTDEGIGGTTVPEQDAKSAKPALVASNSPATEVPVDDNPPVTPSERPEPKPVEDPFAKLPADEIDPRMAILDLSGSLNRWSMPLDDPASLDLELLGGSVFHVESVAKYELKRSEIDGQTRVWTLAFKSKSSKYESCDLGEFRYTHAKQGNQFSFSWLDEAETHQVQKEMVQYLALGLATDQHSRLCRLGVTKTKPPLSNQFVDPKEHESEVSIELDALLTGRLNAIGSPLLIDLDLIGGISGFLADKPDVLHGMSVKDRRKVLLTIPSKLQSAPEWKVFKSDPHIAYLEVQPHLADNVFGIKLAAFATIATYRKEEEVNPSPGRFPTPDNSNIPLSAEPLRVRLNAGLAKRLTDAIKKKLDYETKSYPIREAMINASKLDPMEKNQKRSAIEEEKKIIQSDFEKYEARHKPDSLNWLWTVLSGGGGKDKSGEKDSIRGAIGSAKIGVRISYPCTFKDKQYSIVVFEAGKK